MTGSTARPMGRAVRRANRRESRRDELMAWLKQARINRRYWLVWADGWADNSAASVWGLYR